MTAPVYNPNGFKASKTKAFQKLLGHPGVSDVDGSDCEDGSVYVYANENWIFVQSYHPMHWVERRKVRTAADCRQALKELHQNRPMYPTMNSFNDFLVGTKEEYDVAKAKFERLVSEEFPRMGSRGPNAYSSEQFINGMMKVFNKMREE